MKRNLLTLTALGLALLSLSACSAKTTEQTTTAANDSSAQSGESSQAASSQEAGADVKSVQGLTIAFVPKLTGNAFFESANKGAQKYAKEWGFTVDYQGSPNASVADEVQVINNAAASGVDGICVSSVDATGLDSALSDAAAMGVTIGTWDSDVSDSARTIMVFQVYPEIP